ncbi:hypothetical protein LTS10_011982 [Elasticomyces elasticus]|nr:hypothetical protein LTS10_011982 [Elasticomyces elasticus]
MLATLQQQTIDKRTHATSNMDPHKAEIAQNQATVPAEKQDHAITELSGQDEGDGSRQVLVVVGSVNIGYGLTTSTFEALTAKRREGQKHSQILVVSQVDEIAEVKREAPTMAGIDDGKLDREDSGEGGKGSEGGKTEGGEVGGVVG